MRDVSFKCDGEASSGERGRLDDDGGSLKSVRGKRMIYSKKEPITSLVLANCQNGYSQLIVETNPTQFLLIDWCRSLCQWR